MEIGAVRGCHVVCGFTRTQLEPESLGESVCTRAPISVCTRMASCLPVPRGTQPACEVTGLRTRAGQALRRGALGWPVGVSTVAGSGPAMEPPSGVRPSVSRLKKEDLIVELRKWGIEFAQDESAVEMRARLSAAYRDHPLKIKMPSTIHKMKLAELQEHCKSCGIHYDPSDSRGALMLKIREFKDNVVPVVDTLDFGKYKGMTYQAVLEQHAQYCQWIRDTASKGECCPSLLRFANWLSEIGEPPGPGAAEASAASGQIATSGAASGSLTNSASSDRGDNAKAVEHEKEGKVVAVDQPFNMCMPDGTVHELPPTEM